MPDELLLLHEYFGHTAFRPSQQEVISHLLSGQDVLAVMPTGAGKSICYQIPALMLEGVTLVISPLISLMKDQVTALRQNGIGAAYINSSLTREQSAEVLRRGAAGAYKLIYIAPERLETPSFQRFCQQISISMVTVDEAHCVSQWGHDFRPSYLQIARFVEGLAVRPVVSAFTATATRRVRQDIRSLLKLNRPHELVTSFNRSNLYFEVQRPEDKDEALLKLVRDRAGDSGIVYCLTRKNVEQVCALLCRHGVPATRYHAGLPTEERKKNQEDFLFDRRPVMVATNAFGMGIDKSNVNYVIHYNMPANMESYYQEAGRAGRDGSAADCILLYGPRDLRLIRYLIQNGDTREGAELTAEEREMLRRNRLRQLDQMERYCTGGGCLRERMLEYFGERLEEPCGNCSGCLAGYEDVDVTEEAQKLLSCVVRVERAGYRAGKALVYAVLQGKNTGAVSRLGLDRLSTFGLLKGLSDAHLDILTERLTERGMLLESGDSIPVLELTARAKPVLFGRQKLTVKRRKPAQPAHPALKSAADPVLLDRLKELRGRLGQRQSVPGFAIFSDAVLREICKRLPTTQKELRGISGLSTAKCDRYGEDVLAVVRAYLAEK